MKSQHSSFAVGLIVGLLLGLVLALGVALYVAKVPVPFINKVPQRTAEQDAAEIEKNKNWDPNGPLYGKNPAKAASGAVTPNPSAAASAPAVAARASTPAVAERPLAKASAPASTASQIASTKPGADPFIYFVQVGAFARTEDAEQQRAKLGMLGLEAKLTEREQSGRTIYRVRVGPFDKKAAADTAVEKLTDAGLDAALVRVQR